VAYRLGAPDGSLSLAGFALNVPLAALGGADRALAHPWIPLLAAGKAVLEAAAAAWYFYQMPAKEKAVVRVLHRRRIRERRSARPHPPRSRGGPHAASASMSAPARVAAYAGLSADAETDDTRDDQVDRDEVVQESRHDQDQDTEQDREHRVQVDDPCGHD
jgi:hypothetical protein